MSLRDLAYKIAQEEGINPDLFVRQIEVESAFNPEAKSSAGAMGLAQLMPATAKELGVANPFDPEQSLRGGARYMKQLLGRYNNNQTLAHAAYNAGMGNVDKAGGVPNFKETQNYIAKILGGNSMIGAQAPQQMAQQEKPRGLLGGMIDRDFADQLYMAALAGSPNARQFAPLIQSVQAGRQARREDAKEQKKLELAQKGRNATADYLDKIGQSELGNLVRQGAITGANALSAVPKPDQEKTFQYQSLAKDLLRTGVAKTEAEALQMALSQTKAGTTVNVGPQGEKLPPPPSGYVYRYNPDRTVMLNEQGVPIVVPLSGGPKDETKTEEAKAQSKMTMTDTILQEAQKARELVSPYSTGFGSLLSSIPTTDARQLDAHVRSLKAQATIETLNAMRQQSPTGGALGNVTNQENAMLAAKAGALDPASGAEEFAKQLDDYEQTLLRIVHGKDAGDKIFSDTRVSQPSPAVKSTDDDLLKKYGG